MAEWSPKLTRGLWGLVQAAVRDGAGIADVRAAARAAGETPDAATLSHLYSRVAGGSFARDQEARTRAGVDPDTYLNRRPGGANIADLPAGFSMAGRYRQVVKVTGLDTLTGGRKAVFVNVQFDRLLSRGEAIDLALGAVRQGSPEALGGDLEADYESTWRAA